MDTQPIRIGILEDQQVFLESLAALLESSGYEVVARCSDVEDFMARTQEHPPDVALVDLRLERGAAGAPDGFRAVELLHDFFPQVRPIVLSGDRTPEVMERCLRSGAAGFLCKLNVSCAELVQAVERVARGERLLPMEVTPLGAGVGGEAPHGSSALQRLTPREREVLGFIATGADNLKIAACLNITERTVKAHITSIYRKLDVENRTQMAMLACQLGVARPLAS